MVTRASSIYSEDKTLTNQTIEPLEPEVIKNTLDGISTSKIFEKYTNEINELVSLKQIESDPNILESINNEILSYQTILEKLNNNIITNETLSEAKKDLIASLDGKSVDFKSSPSYDHVYNMVLLVITVGEENQYIASSRLLRYSLTATKWSTYNLWNDNAIVSRRVKYSSYYEKLIDKLSKEYKNSNKNYFTKTEPNFEFSGGSSFVEKDLYYAIHGCNGGVNVTIDNGYGTLVFKDKYKSSISISMVAYKFNKFIK